MTAEFDFTATEVYGVDMTLGQGTGWFTFDTDSDLVPRLMRRPGRCVGLEFELYLPPVTGSEVRATLTSDAFYVDTVTDVSSRWHLWTTSLSDPDLDFFRHAEIYLFRDPAGYVWDGDTAMASLSPRRVYFDIDRAVLYEGLRRPPLPTSVPLPDTGLLLGSGLVAYGLLFRGVRRCNPGA
jgi:hypothetical protein